MELRLNCKIELVNCLQIQFNSFKPHLTHLQKGFASEHTVNAQKQNNELCNTFNVRRITFVDTGPKLLYFKIINSFPLVHCRSYSINKQLISQNMTHNSLLQAFWPWSSPMIFGRSKVEVPPESAALPKFNGIFLGPFIQHFLKFSF